MSSVFINHSNLVLSNKLRTSFKQHAIKDVHGADLGTPSPGILRQEDPYLPLVVQVLSHC